MKYAEILARLKASANPAAVAGMARYGINPKRTVYGISAPDLKRLARQIGTDHALARRLWASGIHDARHIAALIDDPEQVDQPQMEQWAAQFDTWDICDGCCLNLFVRTPFAHRKAVQWAKRKEEFVKRAGFALMAQLAVHDKAAPDAKFQRFLPIIIRESTDGRNYVKKGVNWALRQIGKRNLALNALAIDAAKQIRQMDSSSARWVAADALRELTGEAVQARLRLRREALRDS